MANTIDNRIVQMQFNNSQFESGVKTSISTLDKLKASLKLDAAAKGLQNLNDEAKKFDLNSMAQSIESINSKFSAMGVVIATVLSNITTMAMQAGSQLVKALTVQPIIDGFREYELEMNAVKVMMANLPGTGISEINATLAELNEYADKTVYNFGNMTDAIGKFTAAGVSLEDSALTIKGLSNLAAGAGVSNQRLASAYIQVSQALQAGTFRLMDWNSLQNAGLANNEFRNALQDTAIELGVIDQRFSNFRESLEGNWLTTEVFVATMKKAADETSEWGSRLYAAATEVTTFTQLMEITKEALGTGWGQSLKLIIGDFEEAKLLWTSVSEVLGDLIGSSSDARNEMLRFWKTNHGRDILIQALADAFSKLGSIMKAIGRAWDAVFPPKTGLWLVNMTRHFAAFIDSLEFGSNTIKNIRRTFQGLFSILDIGGKVIKFFGDIIWTVAKTFLPGFLDSSLGVTGAIGDFFTWLNKLIEKFDIFGKAIERLQAILNVIKNVITNFGQRFNEAFMALTRIDLGAFGKQIASLIGLFGQWTLSSNGLMAVFKTMKARILTFINDFQLLVTAVTGWDWSLPSWQDFLNLLTKIGDGVRNLGPWLISVKDSIVEFFKSFADGAGKAGNGFQSFVSAMGSFIADLAKKLWDAIVNIDWGVVGDNVAKALLAAVVVLESGIIVSIMSFINKSKSVVEALTGLLDQLGGTLKAFQNQLNAEALKKIAEAIVILVAAMVVLSFVDAGKLGTAIAAMTTAFAELAAIMLVLSKVTQAGNSLNAAAIGASMVVLAIAIAIIAGAVAKLANVPTANLVQGLAAVAAMIYVMMETMDQLEKMTRKGAASTDKAVGRIAAMVAVMMGLVKVVAALGAVAAILGSMELGQLGAGLGAVTVLMGELVGALYLIEKFGPKTAPQAAALAATMKALMDFALAIAILAVAVKILAGLSLEELGQGLGAIGVLLLGIAGFMKLTKEAELVATAGAMVGLGAAIMLIAIAMRILGTMNMDEMAVALIGLGGALLAIIAITHLMAGALIGAVAMGILSLALIGLAAAIVLFAQIPMDVMVNGINNIVNAIFSIGAAAAVLGLVAPLILLAGVAFIAFGAGAVITAAGVLLLSLALTAFSAVGLAAVPILAAFLLEVAAMVLLAAPMAIVAIAIAALGVALLALGIGLAAAAAGIALFTITAPAGILALTMFGESIKELVSMAVDLAILGAALIVFGAGAAVAAIGTLALGVAFVALAGGLALLGLSFVGLGQGLISLSMGMIGIPVLSILGQVGKTLLDGAFGLGAMGIAAAIAGPAFQQLGLGLVMLGMSGTNWIPMLTFLGEIGKELLDDAFGLGAFGLAAQIAGPGFQQLAIGLTMLGASGFKWLDMLTGMVGVFEPLMGEAFGLAMFGAAAVIGAGGLQALGEVLPIVGAAGFAGINVLRGLAGVFEPLMHDAFGLLAFGAAALIGGEGLIPLSKGIKTLVGTEGGIEVLRILPEVLPDLLDKSFGLGVFGIAAGTAGNGLIPFSEALSVLATSGKAGIQVLTDLAIKMPIIQLAADGLKTFGQAAQNGSPGIKALADALIGWVELQMAITQVSRIRIALTDFPSSSLEEFGNAANKAAPGINTLANSGEEMTVLGQGLTDVANGMTNLAAIIDLGGLAVNRVINLMGLMSEASGKFVSGAEQMNEIATASIALSEAFSSLTGTTDSVVSSLEGLTTWLTTLITKTQDVKKAVEENVDAALKYVKDRESDFKKAGENLIENGFIKGIKNKKDAAKTAGDDIADQVISGLGSKDQDAYNRGTNLGLQAVDGLNSRNQSAKDAGTNFGQGFIDGINGKVYGASEAARAIGAAAVNALNAAIQAASPARATIQSGEWFDQGFIVGMTNYGARVFAASRAIGGMGVDGLMSAIDGISAMIEAEVDTSPTIRPVMDLTDIQNGSRYLNSLLGGTLSTATIAGQASIVAQKAPNNITATMPAKVDVADRPSVEFVQNNYSPKALSRYEIYRQTQNGLRQVGKLVTKNG